MAQHIGTAALTEGGRLLVLRHRPAQPPRLQDGRRDLHGQHALQPQGARLGCRGCGRAPAQGRRPAQRHPPHRALRGRRDARAGVSQRSFLLVWSSSSLPDWDWRIVK